eukprot:8200374-Pyramimonas_sp.AAC.1
MGHRLWIDDVSQTTAGSRQAVRKSLVKCIVHTGKGLARRKLRVSPKSGMLCSKFEDAAAVARAVRL